MSAKSESVRTPVWMRLWELVHGPVVVDDGSVSEALERLASLEEAARRLGALEDVEELRQQQRGAAPGR